MYKFARCQPHAKCPNLQGWYLILTPGDLDTLMELHTGVTYLYYCKFGMDPHLKPGSLDDVLKNPIRLATIWLRTVEKFLMAGITLAVNLSGGMMPLDSVKVLATIEQEKMIWPNHYDDEVIKISRWPDGKHYYLSSNKNRVFVPPKFIGYKDAHDMAGKYTDEIREGSI